MGSLTDPRVAYEGVGQAWARGPALLYDRIARIAIEPFAEELRDAIALDVGAGTGAMCRALQHAGATAIALDPARDMLEQIGDAALVCVTGDMDALPFVDAQFDAVVSGFAINHSPHPERPLAEMGRVAKPGGPVIASVFGEAPQNVSKDIVEGIARDFGYEPPGWYVLVKNTAEPLTARPELLRARAETAGLNAVDVRDVVVEPGLDAPGEIVAYRLGMAHMAPFVASLDTARRSALERQAIVEIAAHGQPVRPRVLILASRAAA